MLGSHHAACRMGLVLALLAVGSDALASRQSLLEQVDPTVQTSQGATPSLPPRAPMPSAMSPEFAEPARSNQQRPEARPNMPLRVINQAQFCTGLRNTFAGYASRVGYDAVQTAMLAQVATHALMDEFRVGRASDYISASQLSAMAKLAYKGPSEGYIPVAQVVGQAMGLQGSVALALSTGELRFIPYAQRGTEIVVIARNAAAISPERARKVVDVARISNIRISILWAGAHEKDERALDEARSLAWLAAQTGGAFVNVSGEDRACAELL